MRLLSSAPRRRRQLTSNVRHHTSSHANRRFCSLRPRFKVQAIREQCGSFQRVNRALSFTALLPLWCVTQFNVSRSYPGSSAPPSFRRCRNLRKARRRALFCQSVGRRKRRSSLRLHSLVPSLGLSRGFWLAAQEWQLCSLAASPCRQPVQIQWFNHLIASS